MNEVFDPYAPQDDWEADREAEMEAYVAGMDVDEMKFYISEKLHIHMKRNNLSQVQVAKICEISQARVSNILNGSGKVSLDYMISVCDKLGLNFNLSKAD